MKKKNSFSLKKDYSYFWSPIRSGTRDSQRDLDEMWNPHVDPECYAGGTNLQRWMLDRSSRNVYIRLSGLSGNY